MSDAPKVTKITKHAGIAGQYSLTCMVQYPGEPATSAEFIGSTYGGPIVLVMPSGQQVFISDRVLERLGSKLTAEWVRKFYA